MIELRWLHKPHDFTGIVPPQPDILQYRMLEEYTEDALDGLHIGQRWSEWIDVPTVSED